MVNCSFFIRIVLTLILLVLVGGCDLASILSILPQNDNTTGKNPTTQVLTVSTEGQGKIVLDPPGGLYEYNAVVSLTAEPAEGWEFKHWKTAAGTVEVWFQIVMNPTVVIMSSDKSVVGVFEKTAVNPPSQYYLTINTIGQGTVATDPSGNLFDAGTTVTLTPTAEVGWQFDHWAGDLSGYTWPAQISLTGDKAVTAVFIAIRPEPPTPTPTPAAQVATPVIYPNGGTFDLSANIQLTCEGTPGATIYYTLDGSDPDNVTGTPYVYWFFISNSTTVKARAYLDGMSPSEVASATFTKTLGTSVWTYPAGGLIQTSPALGNDGTIYFGGLDGGLYALNPDGTEKRAPFIAGGPIYSSPLIGLDDSIYFGCDDNYLYALNSDGKIKWAPFPAGGLCRGTPAMDRSGQTIYIGSTAGIFYAIDAVTGSQVWSFSPQAPILSSAVVGSTETVFFASANGSLHALDPKYGTEFWNLPIGSGVVSSPIIGPGNMIYIGTTDNTFHAVYGDNGTEKWQIPIAGPVYGSAVLDASGMLYFGDLTGKVYSVYSDNGTTRWEFPTGGPIYSTPALSEYGYLYVGSGDFYLHAIRTWDGTEDWSINVGGPVLSSPAVGPDGTIYIGSSASLLYAIKGIGTLPGSGWPMFQHDPKHTGNANPPIGLVVLSLVGDNLTSYQPGTISAEVRVLGDYVHVGAIYADLGILGGTLTPLTHTSGPYWSLPATNILPFAYGEIMVQFMAYDAFGGIAARANGFIYVAPDVSQY